MPRSRIKLPDYVTRDSGAGADGKERFYLRRKGEKKVRLHGVPWTPAFMSQYQAALGGPNVIALMPGPVELRVNSFEWLCGEYFKSAEFRELDEKETQAKRRRYLERIGAEPIAPASKKLFAHVPYRSFNKKAVRAIRDRFSDKPDTANAFKKALSALFAWAQEAEHVEDNPTIGIKKLKGDNPDGHHTWTIEEVEQFESVFPVGTKERLALASILYSGQRASDAIRFGKHSVKVRVDVDGEGEQIETKWLIFTQHKNRRRSPVHMEIPLWHELEDIVAESPVGADTWLTATRGAAFPDTGSFDRWFKIACITANVPGTSHGLRKAAAVRLIERGATEKEVAAITGHTTLKEIERYTKMANQRKLAVSATAKGSKKRVNQQIKK